MRFERPSGLSLDSLGSLGSLRRAVPTRPSVIPTAGTLRQDDRAPELASITFPMVPLDQLRPRSTTKQLARTLSRQFDT